MAARASPARLLLERRDLVCVQTRQRQELHGESERVCRIEINWIPESRLMPALRVRVSGGGGLDGPLVAEAEGIGGSPGERGRLDPSVVVRGWGGGGAGGDDTHSLQALAWPSRTGRAVSWMRRIGSKSGRAEV